MKARKFLHVAAIMLSSLGSLIIHSKAEPAVKKAKKGGDTELSKAHRQNGSMHASDEASQDPPTKTSSAASTIAPAPAGSSAQNTGFPANLILHSRTADSSDTSSPPLKLDPSLMANAERSTLTPSSTVAAAPKPGDEVSRYPWKRQIVTTTFWIGENPSKNNPVPNHASSWDEHWAKNYGGSDDPHPAHRTSDFRPAAFVPGQNPFYIALPYNDIEHGTLKSEAAKKIPWFNKEYKGPTKTVCKDRWIAIRRGDKVCYAQWEDAGPFRTDHVDYVFGNDRPKPNLNHGAGLDVSPAVRDYLGMDSSDVTDWKFVDFDEVPEGPWAKFGENNTFVQNTRKAAAQTQVAQLNTQQNKAQQSVAVR